MKPKDVLEKKYPPSVLIFGDAGTSKTSLISQLSNAFIFDFDDGMRSAATLKDKFFAERQSVTFETFIERTPQKPVAFMNALRKLVAIQQAIAKGEWQHDACGIDSLTGLCEVAQLYVQYIARQDSFAKMEIQNWGSLINEVERFLIIFRSLPVLRVVTAHVDELEEKVEKGALGETRVTDLFPASATHSHGRKKLAYHFDEFWYADSRQLGQQRQYRIHGLPPNNVIKARTRASMGTVVHNDIGMRGLLKMIGYEYGSKAEVSEKKTSG